MTQGESGVCSRLPSWFEAVYPDKCMLARQPMHHANILCLLGNTLVSKIVEAAAIELDELKPARLNNFADTVFAEWGPPG
jgi:hypothetical protein